MGGEGFANDVADPPPTLTVDRAPDKPSLVGVETHNMVVQWSPVCITTQSSGIRVVGYLSTYVLEMRRASVGEAGGWTVQYEGTATYVNINGLRAGRSYEVRVTCKPVPTDPDVVVVAAPPSEVLEVDTPASPPGAPALRLANRQARELEFKWQVPADDGGRPVRQYVFECSPPPLGRELPPSADGEGMYELYRGGERSVVMKPLLPGHTYSVRVKAINEIGEGPFTPLQDFATQAAAPSAPDSPAVVRCGYDSVRLQWPASAGNGAEVTGYFVEMEDGAGAGFVFVGHCSEPNFSMAGLRSGVTYRFRVRAQNAKTLSFWSPVCEARTTPTPPLPPTIITTASTHSSVRISWQPPEHDGGSPVTEYQVEAEPMCRGAKLDCPDEANLVYQGPDTTCAMGGLRAGCSYFVRVRAINAQGRGERSMPVSILTASACPEPPGAPTAPARYQNSVAVAWTPSPHDGGSPITAYRLQGRLLGWLEGAKGKSCAEEPSWEQLYAGLECRANIDKLESGARYEFRVAAANKHGSSGWTPAVSVDTKPGMPLPPVPPLFSLTPVPGSLHLAWQPPYGQGAPVNSYVVQMCAQRALMQAVATWHAPTAATNGAAPLNGDAAPASMSSAESSGQAEMDSAFQAVYHGGDTNCAVSGLKPDTDYAFRVKACSSAGAGSWSEIAVYRTPPAPPSAPQGLRAIETDAGPNQIRLEWQPPAYDHGSPATSFQVDYAPAGRGQRTSGPQWKTGFQGAEESCMVAGLRPGKEYMARVRASNACGWGPWGPAATTATSPDVPDAPAAPTFSHRTATAVRVKWDPPLEDHGAAVIRHELQMAKSNNGQFVRVSYAEGTTFKAQQLDPGTSYSFRVRAHNAVGSGPWSAAASVTTSLAPPLAPTAIRATVDAAAAAVKVAWQAAQLTSLHAACISYELEAVPSNSQRLSADRGSSYRPAAAHVVKQTCSGKVAEHRLSGLQAGCEYRVHLRCIGADGAGHGEWSTPVTVLMPAVERNAASNVAPIAHLAVADSDAKIRRGRKVNASCEANGGDPGSVSEDDAGGKTRAASSGIKAASVVKAAKSQPRQKTWWTRVAKWLGISESTLKTIVFLFAAAVLVFSLLMNWLA